MKKLIKLDKKRCDICDTVEEFLNPDYIIFNSNEEYKINDYVYMGENASISGKIIKNDNNTITVENDFRELTKDSINKISIKNKTDLINILPIIKDIGKIDGIVVNAINDEPYVYNRIFLLKNYIRDILDTINMLSKILKTSNNMIAIKNNESFIIDECLNVIGTYPNIKIALLNDEYLIGHKEYLLKKLNMVDNTLYLSIEDVLNINSIINSYLQTTKYITITYDNKSIIYRVKIGTPLKSILSKYYKIKGSFKIIINGLMTGYEAKNIDDIYISDNIECIYIDKSIKKKELKCFNCGLCEQVCPENVSIFSHRNMDKCIYCGLCSYICPAHINLNKYLGDKNE